MRVPNLEDMIQEVERELIEKSFMEHATRVLDAVKNLNIAPAKTAGGVATWVIDTQSMPMYNPLVHSVSTNAQAPGKLIAPTIKGTLGDPKSFKANGTTRRK